MQSTAITPLEYLSEVPEERKQIMSGLREVILANLPKGFEEIMNYGMLSYVVPHSIYPNGYHCDPRQPLPFLSLASQKSLIAVYHMGIYADESLLNWFKTEYSKQVKGKLDMGKSCIRFKNTSAIPIELIGKLASKMTVEQWIEMYESKLKR